jgi:Spy/CpxP family protein refolding chaperone
MHGVIELVSGALAKTCMSDDQRAAVDKLGKRVADKEHEVADARHALILALAEQVRTGKIDEGALKDEVDALVKARTDASPELRKDLEDLHGILDKDQRGTFVDAIEGRMKELAQASPSYLDSMAKDLKLSDDQKTAIGKVLDQSKTELQDERKNAKAAFDAFRGDDFSIEKILPAAQVGDKLHAKLEGMIRSAKEITPILTPEQRGELADKIEARAGARGSAGTQSAAPRASSEPESVDQSQEALVAARGGFRAGAVRGWGGGYASSVSVNRGYVAGYPFVGGFGPGIW